MLSLFTYAGQFKTPVMAYRSHGSEFLVYTTDFESVTWKDIYSHRLCILTVRPTKAIQQDLQDLLELNGYNNYILVGVSV